MGEKYENGDPGHRLNTKYARKKLRREWTTGDLRLDLEGTGEPILDLL